jgi:integrase/recombinase XerD
MSPLQEALADYLTIRRAMGYKLERAGKLLTQFVDYLDDAGVTTVTIEHAVTWARLPAGGSVNWWAHRLSVVRGFAIYLSTVDPATEVPPTDLLPWRSQRAVPYLYSDDELDGLLAATDILSTPLRRATYHTLLGLLWVTGLRIGEAIRLDRSDLDIRAGLLVVRSTKFGKDRQVPLHPTTTAALTGYLKLRDRQVPSADTSAVFVSTAGTRLRYCNVHWTFLKLVDHAGLTPRSTSCRPRIHDLRHSFAVNTVLDGYRTGVDVQARLPLLSTYLGHVHPANTYWYLSAAPELLELAGRRLEDHQGDGR